MSQIKEMLIELEEKGIVEYNEEQGFYYFVDEGPNSPVTIGEVAERVYNERKKEKGTQTDNW